MEENSLLRNVAYTLFIILSIGYLMYIGASIIVPFLFGLLIAIFLYPINKKIIKVVKIDLLSISISFLVALTPIFLISYLFVIQLSSIIDSLPQINSNLQQGLDKALSWISHNIPFLDFSRKSLIDSSNMSSLEEPFFMIGKGFISTSSFAFALALTLIYSFLLLYYRRSIKNFLIYQFEKKFRSNIRETLTQTKEIVQSYLGGLGIVILFLSVVNSIGLWLIGIQYPLFWGTLAGLLAIIPYIGTALGGLLPFLFAIATTDNSWQPIAILVYYAFIQFFEGNILTPKIVGDKVDINPLFAVLSIVILGTIWGVGGVVLALPIIGIIRIILSQFEATVPISILMSSHVGDKKGIFKKWDYENN